MAENWKTSRLLYLDAGDIDDDRVDFDGLDVLDPTGRKLGDVDGFVVQREAKRPYYVVVDSGGWFTSRSFLLPIGHTRLDVSNKALHADLDRTTIQRFPEFDETRFPQMSEDEARVFNERTLNACCATELRGSTGADRYDYDRWSHYAQPDWWQARWLTSPPARTTFDDTHAVPGATTYDVPPASAARPGERVTAHERETIDNDIDLEPTRADRERLGDDSSNRAQPGDVLGIETGGETTGLGDTARDERKRLEDEEEDAARLRREERKDRR